MHARRYSPIFLFLLMFGNYPFAYSSLGKDSPYRMEREPSRREQLGFILGNLGLKPEDKVKIRKQVPAGAKPEFEEIEFKDVKTRFAASEIENYYNQRDLSSAILYGFVGPDMYKMVQDFDTSNIPGGAISTAFAVRGANVFGKAVFEDVLGKRIGTLVGDGLDKLFASLYKVYHVGYKTITRRSGEPFEHKDIEISKSSVTKVITFLNTIGKGASRLGMKAKVDREEDEAGIIDPNWAPIRKLVEMKLRNQVHLLEDGLKYYAKDKSSRITLYALQIRDSIEVLISDVLLKTKSYKDLGEPSHQAALTIFASSLENDFDSLLKILPAAKRESVTTTQDDSFRRAKQREDYGMPSLPGLIN